MRKILHEAKELLWETTQNWLDDRIPLHGAALAFYTIFSLAPLLIIVVAISGFIFSKEASANQIAFYMRDIVGTEVTKNIMQIMQNAHHRNSSMVATIVGIGILLFGSTTVITQLKNSLNRIWNISTRPGQSIKAFIINRFLALLTILLLSLTLVTSLIIEALLGILKPTLDVIIPLGVDFWNLTNDLVSKIITLLLFAVIFKLLPDIKIKWKIALIGAFITMMLFEIGRYLIGLYLSMGNLSTTYGAAGSFVVFLVWVYYNALIVYTGAEFTHSYMVRYEQNMETSPHVRLTMYPDDDINVDTDALS